MLNDKMVRGTNFTCLHAGPMEGWAQFCLEPPNAPVPMQGKLFLRSLLGSAGLEMSAASAEGCVAARPAGSLGATPPYRGSPPQGGRPCREET
jgi:hypothetical protein